MKTSLLRALALFPLALTAAHAAPIIDGNINPGEYEYGFTDVNEPGVTNDALDMSGAYVSGGSYLYVAWELYDTPYDFDGEDNNGDNYARFAIDYDQDGTVDFRIRIDGDTNINNLTGTVYRGASGITAGQVAGTFSTFSVASNIEAQVPWELFTLTNGGTSVFSAEQAYEMDVRWRIDGGGDDADDSYPTSTTFVTVTLSNVPEPASAGLLLGSGLLLLARRRRK